MEASLQNGHLKPAIQDFDLITTRLKSKKPALFLDFDGTLSPIVEDPGKARISDEIFGLLESLSKKTFVSIISGRGLSDLKSRIKIPEIVLVGSHGFEISKGLGLDGPKSMADKFLPILDFAEEELMDSINQIPGAFVERKKYAIAVHYRNVKPEMEHNVIESVRMIMGRISGLKTNSGKKVFDIKPDVDWHKGKAMEFLYKHFVNPKDEYFPIFIGDDVTDEDAFRSIKEISGIGIIVEIPERSTEATFFLNEVKQVEDLLKLLDKKLKTQ